MKYDVVYEWINKPPGPAYGLSARFKTIRASSDQRARVRGKELVHQLNKKGPEEYKLLRIVKVVQEEIREEIPLK